MSELDFNIGQTEKEPWLECLIQKIRGEGELNTGPEVITLFSYSTHLSMKFFLLITIKMPTTVGILIFMSRKNSILGLSESKTKS